MYFDTIYAISSGEIKSGVVVFRISGEHAFKIIEIFSIRLLSEIEYRKAYVRNLYFNNNYTNSFNVSAISHNIIDKVMLLFFKGPHSFTGEDVVELHAHGSIAIMKMISFELSKFFRHAKPGEFTKKAFLNNKMSLYEVDALQSLLASETMVQHQLALQQTDPTVQAKHQLWRQQLLNIYAFIEAYIDFPEEELPQELIDNIVNLINEIKQQIQIAILENINIEKIKSGIKTAIIGKPNAGKSSLLNLLAKKQVAIVSKTPGTTRDAIESYLDVKGYQINIVDTAGIRQNSLDEIEKIGIDIAKKTFITSDIKIILIAIDDFDVNFLQDIYSSLKTFYLEPQQLNVQKEQIIFVFNKIDLNYQYKQDVNQQSNESTHDQVKHNDANLQEELNKQDRIMQFSCKIKKIFELDEKYFDCINFIEISSEKNININVLLDAIKEKCKNMHPKEPAIISNLRQREYFLHTIFHLNNALLNINNIVFLSEDIRSAILSFEAIIGKIEVEEMLGKIFSEFCIGK